MSAEPNQINPEYLLPGTMVGPWEIVDLLGKGGFGVAYKVRRDGRYYALKLTLFRAADLGAEQRERHEARVRRECGILLQLNHPNIVRVHGFERWPDFNEGYLYIVMDLVNGQKLYAWRDRSVPSLRRICHVFRRISLALAEAHARGAFHRDIKSENVLVGIDGEPILIDWGIARSRGAVTVTQDHTVIGTHSHFPPEYCRYIDDDSGAEDFVWTPQSELHSVGYLLYEVLTGRSPFNLPDEDSTSDENTIIQRLQRTTQAIKSVTPTLPSLVNGKVPGALDRIAMKLLEKNPADRYATGTELAQAFDQALAEADAAWDAPFDVPPAPAPSAPTRGSRPARTPAHKSPEVLPALQEGPPLTTAAPAAAEVSPLRSPSNFRAPTQELKPFEPPNEPEDRKSSPVTPPASAARDQIASRVESPKGRSRFKALAAVGFAVALLVGMTFLRSKKPVPAAPESLLRKVERASAAPASPAPVKPRVDETTSSGVPPLPTPATPARSEALALHVPEAHPERVVAPPPPPQHPTRSATQAGILATRHPTTSVPRKGTKEPAREEDSALEFGQRLGGGASNAPNSKTPDRYHVETGARIRVSLDMNLDSRTVTVGPAAVRLRRAYISNGRVVFPAGTMAYGEARANNSRFTVRFTRLVLPDKTEVPFESLAYDIQDRKPGLAPSRRIAGVQPQDGTGTKVGRAVANTMLTAVNGGLAQDAARNAAETALNSRDPEGGASGGDALLLDAGAEMDMLVTKPF
jgi:serine/threonine protein kinase